MSTTMLTALSVILSTSTPKRITNRQSHIGLTMTQSLTSHLDGVVRIKTRITLDKVSDGNCTICGEGVGKGEQLGLMWFVASWARSRECASYEMDGARAFEKAAAFRWEFIEPQAFRAIQGGMPMFRCNNIFHRKNATTRLRCQYSLNVMGRWDEIKTSNFYPLLTVWKISTFLMMQRQMVRSVAGP